MNLEAILEGDSTQHEEALAAAEAAPEYQRSAIAAQLGAIAREASEALAASEEVGEASAARFRLGRACLALSLLRVQAAKNALLRIADEGTTAAKAVLAGALRATKTPEGRAVLVHLLSDDDACADAINAIGAAPWPEVLPALIEVAEADELVARVAAMAIAKCGAIAGPNEAAAAADFLLQQLDDDAVLSSATVALLRFGHGFPAVATRAKPLAKAQGKRKVAALCLVAAHGDEGNASFLELALSGTRIDEAAAHAFLGPLVKDTDPRVRAAAERTWKALDLK